MKFLIRLILSVFIGGVVGFLVALIGEGLCDIVSAGLVAFFATVILECVFENSSLRWLIKIAGGIVAFFAYLYLLICLEEDAESFAGYLIPYILPYVVSILIVSYYVSEDK